MMRFAALAGALGLLAACASQDRAAMTEFEPLEDKRFRYEAATDAVYPEDSPTAEAERMRWLETYLANNSLCPDSYEITERKVVMVQEGLLADRKRIYYTGTCK